MRRFCVLAIVGGACGEVLDVPSDAALDASPASVKVTALTYAGDGRPDPAARIIFQDVEGTVMFEGPVDAMGKLEAMLPSGGTVTKVNIVADTPTSLRADVTTIMGVQPGDELTLGLPARPTITNAGGQTTMSANFTPIPGATDYLFFTTCGLTVADDTSPVTLNFRDSCHGPTFDLVMVVSGGTLVTPRFISLRNINHQNGQSFTMPGIYSTMGSFTVSSKNVPAEISSLLVTHASLLEHTTVAAQTVVVGDPPAGTLSSVVPFATGVGSRSEVSLLFSRPDAVGFQQHSLHTATPQTGVEVDFNRQRMPWLSNIRVMPTGITWTTIEEGEVPDGMMIVWNGEWIEGGRTTSVEWRIAYPGSTSGLPLPRLPTTYTALDPRAQTVPVIPKRGTVVAVDYDIVTGYAEFRRQPEVLVMPLIDLMGAFIGLPYQRRMYSATVLGM
jgi:hypothetical protein